MKHTVDIYIILHIRRDSYSSTLNANQVKIQDKTPTIIFRLFVCIILTHPS